MHVRVSLYANSRDAVRKALQARGAALSEDYVGATYCVLRCERRSPTCSAFQPSSPG